MKTSRKAFADLCPPDGLASHMHAVPVLGEKHGVAAARIVKCRGQEFRTYGFDPRSFVDIVL